jgi:hypothetical protein
MHDRLMGWCQFGGQPPMDIAQESSPDAPVFGGQRLRSVLCHHTHPISVESSGHRMKAAPATAGVDSTSSNSAWEELWVRRPVDIRREGAPRRSWVKKDAPTAMLSVALCCTVAWQSMVGTRAGEQMMVGPGVVRFDPSLGPARRAACRSTRRGMPGRSWCRGETTTRIWRRKRPRNTWCRGRRG